MVITHNVPITNKHYNSCSDNTHTDTYTVITF